MTRVYYKEAVGAFVVFEPARRSTFEAVSKWKNDIDTKVAMSVDDKPVPVILLANKVCCSLNTSSNSLAHKRNSATHPKQKILPRWTNTAKNMAL